MANKYELKVDNKNLEIKDGFVLTEELNETLDSGTIQFYSENGESDVEPFDSVEITGENINRKKFLLDSFDNEIIRFNTNLNNSDYIYTSTIFSETKALERITLPNKLVTRRYNSTPKTIFQVFKEICVKYLPRKTYYTDNEEYPSHQIVRCAFMYDSELEYKLNVTCPEFSWNNPTLREVLNDLFSVVHLLPIVKDNVITYIDYDAKGYEIDETKLTNKKSSFSSADYVDGLTLPMQNAISDSKTIMSEYVSAKTNTSSSEITTQNAVFMTQKPIYAIRKAILFIRYTLLGISNFEEFNLTNAIVEEDKFKALNPSKEVSDDMIRNPNNYQITCLSYKMGTNYIDIGEDIKVKGAEDNLYHTINKLLFIAQIRGGASTTKTTLVGGDNREAFISLEYDTIDDVRTVVGKLYPTKNTDNHLFSNQTSSTVDINRQSISEYAKVNRLGHKISTIVGDYDKESDIPHLTDYIGDKVLYSRELCYHDNAITFTGKLIDNYVLRDFFTSVDSKRRSWAIASDEEATTRNDVLKFYVCIGASSKVESDNPTISITGITPLIFARALSIDSTDDKIKYACQLFADKDGKSYPNDNNYDRFIMDTNVYQSGMSILIDFDAIDNFTVGSSAEYKKLTDSGVTTEVTYNRPCRYVDDDGEAIGQSIVLCKDVDYGEGQFDFGETLNDVLQTYDKDKYEQLLTQTRKRPIIDGGAIIGQIGRIENHNLYKDNRETIKTTIQFEHCSDDDGFIITEKFVERCPLINNNKTNLKVYQIMNYKYRPQDKKGLGTLMQDANVTWQTSGSSVLIRITSSRIIGGINRSSFAICDEDDNVLLVMYHSVRCYLYLKTFRDDNVYNSVVDRVKIGSIGSSSSELEEAYQQELPKVENIKVLYRQIELYDLKDFDE